GAAVDPLDLLVPASARGQDQYGRRLTAIAPAAQQRQAIHLGQPQIEDDCIVAFVVCEQIGSFAVGRMVYGVARSAPGGRELPGERRLVFYYKHTHTTS